MPENVFALFAGSDFTLQMSVSGGFAFAVGGAVMHIAEGVGYSVVLTASLGLGVILFFFTWCYDDFDIDQSGDPQNQINSAATSTTPVGFLN